MKPAVIHTDDPKYDITKGYKCVQRVLQYYIYRWSQMLFIDVHKYDINNHKRDIYWWLQK